MLVVDEFAAGVALVVLAFLENLLDVVGEALALDLDNLGALEVSC